MTTPNTYIPTPQNKCVDIDFTVASCRVQRKIKTDLVESQKYFSLMIEMKLFIGETIILCVILLLMTWQNLYPSIERNIRSGDSLLSPLSLRTKKCLSSLNTLDKNDGIELFPFGFSARIFQGPDTRCHSNGIKSSKTNQIIPLMAINILLWILW